jgi:S-adenosylmethionine synthetase
LERAVPELVRETLRRIGYGEPDTGFDVDGATVDVRIGRQSVEIQDQVHRADGDVGAGDQGLMFGYATDETPERMPLALALAHQLVARQAEVRRSGEVQGLGPDAKSQVSVRYEGDRPAGLTTIVLASQHSPRWALGDLRRALTEHVVRPCVEARGLSLDGVEVLVNHAGPFTAGGPAADTGLTGRKIIVDTYGGSCPHGGGAFSGKDPTKVDRSAAYVARWMARHVVEAQLAGRVTIQLAYAIGGVQPVSVHVDTHGTGRVPDPAISEALHATFDLSPAGILTGLNLRRPIYGPTAAYGHFGRRGPSFPWEDTPRLHDLNERLRAQGATR